MKTTPCQPLPTKPVSLTDAILGNVKQKRTNAHVHTCIQWHAARTRELMPWARKPQTRPNQAAIGQLAEGLRKRGSKDKGILPHMPEALADALKNTSATQTLALTGGQAPTQKQWQDRVDELKKAAHKALEIEKDEKNETWEEYIDQCYAKGGKLGHRATKATLGTAFECGPADKDTGGTPEHTSAPPHVLEGQRRSWKKLWGGS